MADDERAETLAELGEFAVIDRLVAGRAQPADRGGRSRRRRRGGDRARRPDRGVDRHAGRGQALPAGLVDAARRRPQGDRPERRRHRGDGCDADGVRRRLRRARRHRSAPTRAALVRRHVGGGRARSARASSAAIWCAAPQWVISVTALGDLGGRAPVLLGGARPGDTVAVVGDLGRSAAGYALWLNDVRRTSTELRRRHLVPERALRAGARRRRCRCHGDDRRLRRAARRPRPHRRRVRGRASTCRGTRWAPIATPSPRPPRRRGRTRGTGCSAGGEDHALVATFPGAVPAGWRVIGVVRRRARRGCWSTASRGRGSAGWQSF